MLRVSQFGRAAGLAALISVSALATPARDCTRTVAEEPRWMKPIAIPLETDERLASRPLFLPRGRVAIATQLVDASKTVTLGRVLIAEEGADRPLLKLELPEVQGRPTYLRDFSMSMNGRYLGGSMRNNGPAPGLLIDTEEGIEVREPIFQRIDPIADSATIINDRIERALNGDARSTDELAEDGYNEHHIRCYENDRFGWDELLEAQLRRDMRDYVTTNYDLSNIDFHPDGKTYLLTSRHMATIRSVSNNERRRLLPFASPGEEERRPYSAYFINRGASVVSVSLDALKLWDANSGTFQHEVNLNYADIETVTAPITFSPDRDKMSILMHGPTTTFREVWAVRPKANGDGVRLKRLYRVYSKEDDLDAVPLLALANGDRRVVGQASGSIQVFRAPGRWWKFRFGGARTNGPRKLDRLEISADGNFVAAAGRNAQRLASLELWSVNEQKGIRVSLPTVDSHFTREVVDLRFAPDSGQLLLMIEDTNRSTGSKKLQPYRIDVYRLAARMIGQPPIEEPVPVD